MIIELRALGPPTFWIGKSSVMIVFNQLKESVILDELRSVAKACNLYKQLIGKSGTKRLLYLFDLIDTNYVTITNKDYKIFGNQYIPTPMDLYNDFKDEE